jgi:hypothetical protein
LWFAVSDASLLFLPCLNGRTARSPGDDPADWTVAQTKEGKHSSSSWYFAKSTPRKLRSGEGLKRAKVEGKPVWELNDSYWLLVFSV